jgi:glycosyltransferase involved in cell wall biosynthesis
MAAPPPVSLVTPWFGNANGGAEVFCAGLARALAAAGLDVEVLTTCCRDPFHDWGTDHLPPGESAAHGVRVRRFPVSPRDADLYAHLYGVVANGGELAIRQEEELLANSINSEALCDHVHAQRDARLHFFMPYMYGTTFNGVAAAGQGGAFLIPCLHNEPFAYLVAMQRVFGLAGGCLFLSQPERDFASALYNLFGKPQPVLGAGVDRREPGDPARFRRKSGVHGPFVLFVGRKVPGKGADLLVRYFGDYLALHHRDDLRLVMIGSGEMDIPADLASRVLSVDVDDAQDVRDAMAACEFLVHPSYYESFSLVMMEAWLERRPVLVNGECEVTLHHVLRSNGGLYFTNFGEFCETVALLRSDGGLRRALGSAGEKYVLANYTWPDVVARFLEFLKSR